MINENMWQNIISEMEQTSEKDILEVARIILSDPLLSKEDRKFIVEKSKVFENLSDSILRQKKDELMSFKHLLTGKHLIFTSSSFFLVNNYNPLNPKLYYRNQKIYDSNVNSNRHGNNYLYTLTNLRNGVLFTYYDNKTDSYIPVTFNTNEPICMVAPDPFCINGNVAEVIKRMADSFNEFSLQMNLKNFPLVFKGLSKETAESVCKLTDAIIVDYDLDATTITAEMNFPQISYDINRLKKMVQEKAYHYNPKKPKVINTIRKNDTKVYCDEWTFNSHEANSIALKWVKSKITRLERKSDFIIDPDYLIHTVLQSISKRPPGKQNIDYFALAARAKFDMDEIKSGDLLGIVIASRCNKKIAALNAVVVPVQKKIRDLGYYTVYKLAEKMSEHGISSYWHGPKELDNDVRAVIEFLGTPDLTEKMYCLKF